MLMIFILWNLIFTVITGVLAIARCLEINHLSKLKKLVIREIGASSSALCKLLLSFQGVDSSIEILDLSGNYFCPPRKVKKVYYLYTTDSYLNGNI